MKLGILNADPPDEAISARFGEYARMFEDMFTGLSPAPDFSYHYFSVHAQDFPAHIDACDAYLLTGSRHSAYDDEAWIAPLEDFVRTLVNTRKPLVGICFGHQLVAQALGGRTTSNVQGWGIGVHEYRLQEPTGESLALLCCHQDHVESLPEGSERLLSSDFCPNAAFRIGGHVLCYQGHPEISREFCRYLLDWHRGEMGELTYGEAVASLSRATDELRVARDIVEFLTAGV